MAIAIAVAACCGSAWGQRQFTFEPPQLVASVPAGDRLSLPVDITQDPLPPSVFQIYPYSVAPSLEDALRSIDTSTIRRIAERPPRPTDFPAAPAGNAIVAPGSPYTAGNQISIGGSAPLDYTGGRILPHASLGETGRYFTRSTPAFFLFAADVAEGGSITIEDAWPFDTTGHSTNTSLGELRFGLLDGTPAQFEGFMRQVSAPDGAGVLQLILVSSAPSLAQSVTEGTTSAHTVSNLEPGSRVYAITYLLREDDALATNYATGLAGDILNAVSPSWLGGPFGFATNYYPDPESGLVSIDVGIDSAGLAAGAYEATLGAGGAFAIEGELPVNITVTSSPGFRASTDAVDIVCPFGQSSSAYTLQIRNDGDQALDVEAAMVGSAAFSVSPSGQQTLAPGEELEVRVLFTPTSSGETTGTLSFTTNDPTDASVDIPLVGYLPQSAPVLAATDLIIPVGADTGSTSLSITHQGQGTATWTLQLPGEQESLEVLAASDWDSELIAAYMLPPGTTRYPDTGGMVVDGGDGAYSAGNRLAVETHDSTSGISIHTELPYTGGEITTVGEPPHQIRYFTKSYDGLFVAVADAPILAQFRSEGGRGGSGGTRIHGGGLGYTGSGLFQSGYVHTYGRGTPSTAEFGVLRGAPTASFSDARSPDWQGMYAWALNPAPRFVFVTLSGADDSEIPDETLSSILLRLATRNDRGWLSAGAVSSGQLADGATAQATVSADKMFNPEGTHPVVAKVLWDDGMRELPYQVSFDAVIGGGAALGLSSTEHDFGLVELGQSARATFTVTNSGGATVQLDLDISGQPSLSLLTPSSPMVLPSGSTDIVVEFDPRDTENLDAILRIQTNAFDQPVVVVDLSGRGWVPADIATSPETLQPLGAAGYPATARLQISNVGADPMLWPDSTADPLVWSIASASFDDWPAHARAILATPSALDGIAASIPDRFDFDATTGPFASSLTAQNSAELYSATGGNNIHVNGGGTPLPYSGGDLPGGGSYTTSAGQGMFVFCAEAGDALSVETFGSLPFAAGDATSFDFDLPPGDGPYSCWVKTVGDGPYLTHLWISNSAAASHSFATTPSVDSDTLAGIAAGSDVHLLVFATDPVPISTQAAKDLAAAYLAVAGRIPIDVSPASGSVLSGETQSLTITTGEIPAFHPPSLSFLIEITSNAPAEPLATVGGTLEIRPSSIAAPVGEVLAHQYSGSPMSNITVDLLPSIGGISPTWSVKNTPDWLRVSPAGGALPATLSIDVDSTAPGGLPRAGTIVLEPSTGTDLKLPITLEALQPDYTRLQPDWPSPAIYAIQSPVPTGQQAYLAKISARDTTMLGAFAFPYSIAAIAIDRTARELYVLHDHGSKLGVIDPDTWTLDRIIPLATSAKHAAAYGQGRVALLRINGSTIDFVHSSDGSAAREPLDVGGTISELSAGGPAPRALFAASSPGRSPGRAYRFSPDDLIAQPYQREITRSSLSSPIIASASGERLFLGIRVLDRNLNPVGNLTSPVVSSSPRGVLATTATGVVDLAVAGSEILPLPFLTQVTAFWGPGERVIAHDRATGTTVSLPVRDYSAAPATIDLGEIELGKLTESSFTVTNLGAAPLTLTGASSGLPGIEIEVPAAPIPPASTAPSTFRVLPMSEGALSGQIRLDDSYLESPQRTVSVTADVVFDPAVLPGYAAWQIAHFGAAGAIGSGPLENIDRDTFPNYAEFIFGLDPHQPGDPDLRLPRVERRPDSDYTLSFTVADGMMSHLTFERSTDAAVWEPISSPADFAIESTTTLGDGTGRVVLALQAPAAGTVFYRAVAKLYPAP